MSKHGTNLNVDYWITELMSEDYQHSYVTLAAKEKIDQLQRQNDEIQDRIVKLEVAASMDMRDLDHYGDLRMDRLREYFGNPTGRQRLTQSLQHIECRITEEYTDWLTESWFFNTTHMKAALRDYKKLRQQSTNGSDGDE